MSSILVVTKRKSSKEELNFMSFKGGKFQVTARKEEIQFITNEKSMPSQQFVEENIRLLIGMIFVTLRILQ